MKRYINASIAHDVVIDQWEDIKLVRDYKGVLWVEYPDGYEKFSGGGSPRLPEAAWRQFSKFDEFARRLAANPSFNYYE